jgi:hypothetical protein
MALGRKLVALSAIAAMLLLLALSASPAGARESVEFETEATLAANGPIPPVPANPLEEVKEACGSETAVFGSELFTTPPSKIKVKNEWADIVPGKEMMVSGTISNVEFSGGDLSIDHPFSVDFTFDVLLDEPYWPLARQLGPGAAEGAGEHELHMELEVGQLLHALPQLTGPAEGEPWELLPFEQTKPPTQTLNVQAFENLEGAFIPKVGERIAMRGRWIIDCGHNDFHTELHPITFMAFGHHNGSKTIAHVISNPYRVDQLYGPGPTEVNSSNPQGSPFPEGFEKAVKLDVLNAIFGVSTPITMKAGIERTQPSTTPFTVCPPEGAPEKPKIGHHFVAREGVGISVKRKEGTNCAIARMKVGSATSGKFGKYTALQPPARTCVLPWNLVTAEVAGGLGIGGVKHNEVERIIVNAAGGTFTISHSAETTGPLPFNATAEEVQTALEGLVSVGPGNVHVEGGPGAEGGGTPYTIAFIGALGEKSITPLTTDREGLVAGSTSKVKLATVIVLVPGGELDLHRFVLALVEQESKAMLEAGEELGQIPPGSISRIEANIAKNPVVACLDPLSGQLPGAAGVIRDQTQAFPYYGEIVVE